MLVQEKLLRVIEYGQLERWAAASRCGWMCAWRAPPTTICRRWRRRPSRADLLDRLAFDVVQLPPLRQRRPDIMLLAEHFAIQMCRELALPLFPRLYRTCQANVARVWLAGQRARTRKNVVERSVYRHGDSDSPLDEIVINPFAPREATPVAPIPEDAGVTAAAVGFETWQLEQEKALIEAALQQGRFNQRKAAQLLGLTYHQLRGMLKSNALLQNGEADEE